MSPLTAEMSRDLKAERKQRRRVTQQFTRSRPLKSNQSRPGMKVSSSACLPGSREKCALRHECAQLNQRAPATNEQPSTSSPTKKRQKTRKRTTTTHPHHTKPPDLPPNSLRHTCHHFVLPCYRLYPRFVIFGRNNSTVCISIAHVAIYLFPFI